MPDLNLSWTPAPTNANSIGQRAKAIARINGLTPNMTAVFIPANNMGPAVSSAIFRTNNNNIVYRFMVENICSSGGPTPNTNGVKEGIIFACVPPTVKAGDITNTTYTARILKGAYTQIDGVNYPNSYSDIQAVEYSLYNAANTTLIQGPILVSTITGTGTSESFEHTFTGLTASTSYTPRFALLATVDGITVRSDSVGYLGTACVHPAITTSGGTPPTSNCMNYIITNSSTTQGDDIIYSYSDCNNVPQSGTVAPNSTDNFCALEGSPTIGLMGDPCAATNCVTWNLFAGTGGASIEWLACGANTPSTITFTNGYSICTNSGYTTTSGNVNVLSVGAACA